MRVPALLGPSHLKLCATIVWVMLVATILQGCGNGPSSSSKRSLPHPMMAGYTSGASAEKITKAVRQGLNVVFWSFMELEANTVTGGLDSSVIGPVHEALANMGRSDVLHFLSFGGWDVKHTLAGTCGNLSCTGEAYAASFRAWNEQMKSNISGFPGFAGIDWDLEGVDDLQSPSNNFTLATFEIMLDMTKDLSEDFLISMVPPQSYFNCQDSGFNMDLENKALSDPNFTYAGKNAYALLYAKCPACFDVVMVQLYESYSQAGFDLFWGGDVKHVGSKGWPRAASNSEMKEVIHNNMQCLASGWTVNFNGFWNVPTQTVVVPPDKIVIGLANGWATNPPFKVPLFAGTACGEAWCDAVKVNGQEMTTRGFMYWDINDDTSDASLVFNITSAIKACPQGKTSYMSASVTV